MDGSERRIICHDLEHTSILVRSLIRNITIAAIVSELAVAYLNSLINLMIRLQIKQNISIRCEIKVSDVLTT